MLRALSNDWIVEQYKNRSAESIAREYGCDTSTIVLRLRRAGIKIRPACRRVPEINSAWLLEQNKNRTPYEIAEELGCQSSPKTQYAISKS